MLPDPIANYAVPSGEPMFTHLAPQLAGVVTTFFPALGEISAVFFDRTCAGDKFPFGEIAGTRPTTDRASVDAHRARDLCLRQPTANQLHHRFISSHSTITAPLLRAFGTSFRRWSGLLDERSFWRIRNSASSLCHEPMMWRQNADQSFAKVSKKMPPIGDLDRKWRGSIGGLS